MQAGNVVLVLLQRLERNRERQIGQAQMRTFHLIDRHLVFLEAIICDALPQCAAQNLVR